MESQDKSESRESDKKVVTYEDLCCYFKDAVVRVNGVFSLTDSAVITPGSGLPNNLTNYFTRGNGFFVVQKNGKKLCRYIVCPAVLVLIPPNCLGENNRFPFVTTDLPPLNSNLPTVNRMTKVSRIMVEVFNVNGGDKSYIYQAELVSVDGAGNIALLRISHKEAWNKSNPKIKECHPYFDFGCAGKTENCERIWSIGDSYYSPRRVNNLYGNVPNANNNVLKGRLLNNHHIDLSGLAQQQMILVDIPCYDRTCGMPILDKYARVIGMQTTALSTNGGGIPLVNGETSPQANTVMAVTDFYIKRLLKVTTYGENSKYGGFLELIKDSLGDFYRYKKGYLGLAWQSMYGIDYVAPQSTSSYGRDLLYDATTFTFTEGPQKKNIQGLTIIGVGGDNSNLTFVNVPGNTAYVVSGVQVYALIPDSPLLNQVTFGDILTKINKEQLGVLDCQYSPSLVTWTKAEGEQVSLTFRKASDNFDNEVCLEVTLIDYPPLMDYPWYAIGTIPEIVAPQDIYTQTRTFPIPRNNFRPVF